MTLLIALFTIMYRLYAGKKDVLPMQVTLSDEKTKELLTEILAEMIKQKREFFYEIILEAMEDAALANAIAQERKNDFVDENKILEILEG